MRTAARSKWAARPAPATTATATPAAGASLPERKISRSATFAFTIGDRYFGTIMAYVHEPHAARYKFTSALPTQLLKSLGPQLLPVLERSGCGGGGD